MKMLISVFRDIVEDSFKDFLKRTVSENKLDFSAHRLNDCAK